MATILNPDTPTAVEYDKGTGRATKTFPNAHAAKRFWLTKERAGRNPQVVSTDHAPTASGKHTAVYMRVSTKEQDTASQEPDLQRWAALQDGPVVVYTDTKSGKNMDRPGWRSLETAIRQGRVSAVVVWRLDRLGRTASGLTKLFDELRERKTNLVSLKDGIDLNTTAGRLMANVLASVAQYETEVRSERVMAGQAVARANGKRWGGSKPGKRKRVTDTKARIISTMKAQGEPITAIAKAVGLSRPTIYDVLRATTAAPACAGV